jgi:hypothetical protein
VDGRQQCASEVSARQNCGPLLAIVAAFAFAFSATSGAVAKQALPTLEDAVGDRIRIAYEAPLDCPAKPAFLDAVRARLTAGWEAPEGELARIMDVRVRSDGVRYVATLTFTTPEGIDVRRVVSGKSCDSVVTGIALVAALAIDARLAATPQESAEEPPSRPSEPLAAKPRTEPSAARVSPPAPAPDAAPGSKWRAELGTRISLVTGIGPASALGPGAFVRGGPPPFKLGLVFDSVRSGLVREHGVRATYELHSVRLEGGAALPATQWLELEALCFLEAGSLSAATVLDPPVVVRPSRGFATFVAPGAAVGTRLRVPPFFLGVEGMARFPLIREQFYVRIEEQRRPVHRVPYFSLGVALMLGAGF